MGDLPLPQASPAPSHKRERDSDSPVSSAVSVASDSSVAKPAIPEHAMRSIAGKSRVSKEGPSLASSTFAQPLRPQSSSPMSAMAIAASGDSEKVASSSSSGVANGGGSGGGGGATQSFALPVHTDELGRLPLHPGFNVSYSTPDWGHAQQQQQQQQQQALPHGVSSVVATSSAVPAASRTPDIVSAQFDPRLMAMYNLQGPGFGDMFNAASAVPSEPSAFAPQQLPPDLQAMAAAAAAAGAAGDAMDATGGAMTSEELAFADNTLAMWSTAPTSFEYVQFSFRSSGGSADLGSRLFLRFAGGTIGGRTSTVLAERCTTLARPVTITTTRARDECGMGDDYGAHHAVCRY